MTLTPEEQSWLAEVEERASRMKPRDWEMSYLNPDDVPRLIAEVKRLNTLTTDPGHGNEYAIVCHYKEQVDEIELQRNALLAQVNALREALHSVLSDHCASKKCKDAARRALGIEGGG